MPSYSIPFTLVATALLVNMAGEWLLEGFGRGKNTVRNRDTGLRLIESSQDIYIFYDAVRTTGEDYRKFKTKSNKKNHGWVQGM
jgi:hypothetical protein